MNKAASAFQNRNALDKQVPGEPPDFSKLYDQYAPTLLGVLTKLVKDKSQAVTLLEVVFRKFMGQTDLLQSPKRPLFVSLLQTAQRAVIDAISENRHLNLIALQVDDDGKSIHFDGPKVDLTIPTPSQNTPSEDQRKRLLDSVLFENCTLEEAASTNGIPLDLARQQLRLAFQQVRTPKA